MTRAAPASKFSIDGAAGAIEAALHDPGAGARGIVVIAHPHPLFGGTMENKVVQTLAKAFSDHGWIAARFNFRGIGASAGSYDEGRGEADDMQRLVEHLRERHPGLPVVLAGFSFGGFVAAVVATRVAPQRLLLVAPAVSRFSVPAVPAGTLVVHGETDDVVPLSAVLDWARPQDLPVLVVPGVEHFFHGRLHHLKELVGREFGAA